ncbi:MAG: fused MFS/spermidine synthase [Nitrosomonadales bacterium]|nr:fused MFS/spermidine synthase [Nitrosomonadales bacterium]
MTYPIDISEEAGVRYLHFGSLWIQGAMRIARPWHLELDYTREMMASLLMRDDSHFPRKVLLIGLGAASITKFLYRNYPRAHLTVVEIEPRVVAAARQFFKLPEDPKRLNIVIADGAQFVAESGQKYDLILVDGFDEDARPGALDTLPFYQLCRARMNDNGILAVNLLGRSRGFQPSLNRMREAFDTRALAFPSSESGNVIALAATGDPIRISLDELKEQADALKIGTGVNLLPTLTRIELSQTCPGGVFYL